jgi:hypothetical protein
VFSPGGALQVKASRPSPWWSSSSQPKRLPRTANPMCRPSSTVTSGNAAQTSRTRERKASR